MAFAPDAAHVHEGFEEGFYAQMFDLEASNFWFVARARLVNAMLRRYFPGARCYLEIGCGSGYMLAQVEREFPAMRLSGSEVFMKGLEFARRRVPGVELLQMDARAMPYDAEFDVIGAYDVLEHVEQDTEVLGQIQNALAPGGMVVLTVPQHPWLWSYVDEYAHHQRRYTRVDLLTKVQAAGFTVLRCTSFVSLLLPAMYLSRLRNRQRREDYDDTAELRTNRIANSLMGTVMDWERMLIKSGVPMPAGGSLLLVARKH